ncbi:MAG: rhodanese-like domain-containing protein [Burkholderiales bacterium]|nr:rhodanese-like domain-containing protein [Burkholderiales bacterium]MCW5574477.1 rhodanese-like domain-containing protein [Burkholderiales bacterium]
MDAFIVFLQKSPFNMMLFGAAVATGAMLLWPLLMRPFRAGREVSAHEAVQLINRRDALVVDVRDTGEFEAGHVAGARHVPEKQLVERLRELEKFKTRPIIVTCRSGTRSDVAVQVLRRNGFGEAMNLRGGIGAWEQAGMPLEKR